jgi:cytidylate kinase
MSAIIYGPQGCGKTTNAEKLAKHLGLSNILDEFRPGQELNCQKIRWH